MQQLKLIVFDWDGTLMDSEAAIVAAITQAYRDDGLAAPTYQEIRATIGLSLVEAVQRLTPGLDADKRTSVALGYRRNYTARRTVPALFPGVRETLIELRDIGYCMAVATGKSQIGLQRALDETGLGDLFATTRTADLSEPKPSPKMLQEIMIELDVHPSQALMIGDTEYDLAMAEAAGTRRAGVSYGTHPVSRLLSFDPAFVLNSFGELPEKLRILR